MVPVIFQCNMSIDHDCIGTSVPSVKSEEQIIGGQAYGRMEIMYRKKSCPLCLIDIHGYGGIKKYQESIKYN